MGWGRSIATPTSDSLVEAVYPSELDRIHEGAPEFLAKPPPEEALARWMDCSCSPIPCARVAGTSGTSLPTFLATLEASVPSCLAAQVPRV